MKNIYSWLGLTLLCAVFFDAQGANSQGDNVTNNTSTISADYAEDLTDTSVKTRYQLISEDEVIGSLISERKSFVVDNGFEIIVTGAMEIAIDSFWGNYHFVSDEELVINETGLTRYKGIFDEDKQRSSVMIDLDDGNVRIYGSDGANDKFSYEFGREEYDAVSENAPWIFVRSGDEEKRLRVLDLEDFEIKETIYRYIKSDSIDIKGKTFDCHRISFSTPAKRGEQCIIVDSTGAWIAHESGRDADGDYTVRLSELTYSVRGN